MTLLSLTHLFKSSTNLTPLSLHIAWPTPQTPLPSQNQGLHSSVQQYGECPGRVVDGPWRRQEMLFDVSSASQPLILVLLRFLGAQQSKEQSNPFGNLFLLLYSFEEVMTLEIASPGGMKGQDPEPHYTSVPFLILAACSSCPEHSVVPNPCLVRDTALLLDESIKVMLLQAATR